jgi:hypothetical protein
MMIPTDSPIYQKAFEQYMRKGTPIEVSFKRMMKAAETSESHTTTHYIWRTAGDDKVRASHAANDGKIIAWDNPPTTGHPGEDINCRCVAEPYYGITEPPLEPVYPELLLIPFLRVGRTALIVASRVLGQIFRRRQSRKPEDYTDHGALRGVQRKITPTDKARAIQTAKETGNVTTKIGKYVTKQIHYRGSNGITVVVETGGRNAGKVITFWYH